MTKYSNIFLIWFKSEIFVNSGHKIIPVHYSSLVSIGRFALKFHFLNIWMTLIRICIIWNRKWLSQDSWIRSQDRSDISTNYSIVVLEWIDRIDCRHLSYSMCPMSEPKCQSSDTITLRNRLNSIMALLGKSRTKSWLK